MFELVVLGLDISKNRTGWAVGFPGMRRPSWGTFGLPDTWHKKEGQRLNEWRDFLERKIDEHGVNYFAMELLMIQPGEFTYDSHIPMAWMHGVVVETAYKRGIRYGAVPVSSWRAHFLGTKDAPKGLSKDRRRTALKDMAQRQAANRGWLCEYHDEAEALGIMDFALFCLDPDYEHKVGPLVRRAELKAEIAAFRGESP